METPATIYDDIAAGRAEPVGLTVDQYHFLIASHLLPEDTTTELIDGVIVKKDRSAVGEAPMTVGDRHRLAVIRLASHEADFRPHGCYLQTQQPIVLPPHNEPEPDGSVIRGSSDDTTTKPRASNVLAVIEVADRSLHRDLGPKLRAYAGAGIPQYVVADLQHDVVLVHTGPRGAGYADVQQLRRGESLSVATGVTAVVQIAVERLLP